MCVYPEAIFFDFDGVIIDSVSIKKEAFRKLFKDFDQGLVEKVVAYHVRHGGISRVKKIQYFFEQVLKKPLSAEALKEWSLRFSELVTGPVIKAPWIPGVENFLKKFENKITMFVVSGTPQAEMVEIVSKRNIRHYFTEVFGSPTLKPTHVRNMMKQYHLNHQRCYFIGDAMTDYQAALDTGLNFIGIQGDNSFPEGTLVLPDCRCLEQNILY